MQFEHNNKITAKPHVAIHFGLKAALEPDSYFKYLMSKSASANRTNITAERLIVPNAFGNILKGHVHTCTVHATWITRTAGDHQKGFM